MDEWNRMIERYVIAMEAIGIRRRQSAPAIMRFFWRHGIRVRPPLYQSFWGLMLFMGGLWSFSWLVPGLPALVLLGAPVRQVAWYVAAAVLSGFAYGVLMSAGCSLSKRRWRLPSWDTFKG